MNFETNVRNPKVGTAVYYFVHRTIPGCLYYGLVKKVSNRRIEVLVPHLSGGGWDHMNPSNVRVFTWREARKKWGELDDGYGYDCILFLDPVTEAEIRSSFESLGSGP